MIHIMLNHNATTLINKMYGETYDQVSWSMTWQPKSLQITNFCSTISWSFNSLQCVIRSDVIQAVSMVCDATTSKLLVKHEADKFSSVHKYRETFLVCINIMIIHTCGVRNYLQEIITKQSIYLSIYLSQFPLCHNCVFAYI